MDHVLNLKRFKSMDQSKSPILYRTEPGMAHDPAKKLFMLKLGLSLFLRAEVES